MSDVHGAVAAPAAEETSARGSTPQQQLVATPLQPVPQPSVAPLLPGLHVRSVLTVDQVADLLRRMNLKLSKKEVKSALKNAGIRPGDLVQMDALDRFYHNLKFRPEVAALFQTLVATPREFLLFAEFRTFLRDIQKMTALSDARCYDIYVKYSVPLPDDHPSLVDPSTPSTLTRFPNRLMNIDHFATFLMSSTNSIMSKANKRVVQDMTRPLTEYFIMSSHNTYLVKDQLTGDSSVDGYVRALLLGCKSVELDCYDGPNNEPVVYHGRTLVSRILFRDVIETIQRFAFAVSYYPLTLSIECHCSVEQQEVMTLILKTILGPYLLAEPISDVPGHIPSPEDLKYKILVKSKVHEAIVSSLSSSKRQDTWSTPRAASFSGESGSVFNSSSRNSPRGSSCSAASLVLQSTTTGNNPRSGPHPATQTMTSSNLDSDHITASSDTIITSEITSQVQSGPSVSATIQRLNDDQSTSCNSRNVDEEPHSLMISSRGKLAMPVDARTSTTPANSTPPISTTSCNDNHLLGNNMLSNSPASSSSSFFDSDSDYLSSYSASSLSDPVSGPIVSSPFSKISSSSPKNIVRDGPFKRAINILRSQTFSGNASTYTGITSPNLISASIAQVPFPSLSSTTDGMMPRNISYFGYSDTGMNSPPSDCFDSLTDDGKSSTTVGSPRSPISPAIGKLRMAASLAALVIYMRGVHFDNFTESLRNFGPYSICSLSEKRSLSLRKQNLLDYINHNSKFMTRVYPAGYRVTSKNYNPVPHWDSGCQMVAVNFQTYDKGMQLNLAMFSRNGNCGYYLKPDHLRLNKADVITHEIPVYRLQLQLISGQQLPKKRKNTDEVVDPYVEIELINSATMNSDSGNSQPKMFRSKSIQNNGFNPYWDQTFEFLVESPHTSFIRFQVFDKDITKDACIGVYTIAVSSMEQGYRHVPLFNLNGTLVKFSTLFLRISMTPYKSS